MDPDHPNIDESRFNKFDWVGFYIHAEESILPDMPGPRSNMMSTHFFVDANHASDKLTRRSQKGILVFCSKHCLQECIKPRIYIEKETAQYCLSILQRSSS